MTVREKVRQFLEGELKRDLGSVKDGDSLLESGSIDSVGVMSLVAFLEREYAVSVSDDDLMPENFDTVNAVVAFIERKQGGTVV